MAALHCLVTTGITNLDQAMAHTISAAAAIVALTVALGPASAAAQQAAAPEPDSGLKRNFAAEHEIGRRYRIDPAELPAPKAGRIATGRSLILNPAVG